MLRLVVVLAICTATHQYPQDCDPLTPEYCYFPFPSNFWVVPDSSTPTGKRLNLNDTTFPNPRLELSRASLKNWNKLDGFAPSSSILTYFSDVSLDGVARWWNIERSVDVHASPTILLDSTTGELIPHWAELDARAFSPKTKSFMIWPAYALTEEHTYIVAMRNLKTVSGETVKSSTGFEALRDNKPSSDPRINGRRELYKSIFASLAKSNVPQSSLQLAWDFTVASSKCIHEPLLWMRDDALKRMPKGGPQFKITKVEEVNGTNTNRYIHGTMEVPTYLNTILPVESSHIVLNSTGYPVYQRHDQYQFLVSIPQKLATQKLSRQGLIMNYGHGLFGSYNELRDSYLQQEANEANYVVGGCDWIGMANDDEVTVALILVTDFTHFKYIPDRLTQSMINHMYLTELLGSEAFITAPQMMPTNVPLINPKRKYYYGNSNGGILGATYTAISPSITHSVLGVGGAPYNLLLGRSNDFTDFLIALRVDGNEPDIVLWMNLAEQLWTRAGSGGYARHLAVPLPNTPKKTVAIHYGLGDAQVTWLAAHFLGRSAQAKMWHGNVREGNETLYGFPMISTQETSGAVIQGWNFGAPLVPTTNTPPDGKTDTHECTRRDPRAIEATRSLFEQGVLKNFCGSSGCQPVKGYCTNAVNGEGEVEGPWTRALRAAHLLK